MVQKGFTFIELLIVIATLAILSTTVIVALNPLEYLFRANDTRRISAVVELGHAMDAYVITRTNGVYPTLSPEILTWQSSFLMPAGEIGVPVSVNAITLNCTTNSEGNLCYDSNGTDAVIWTVLESRVNRNNAGCIVPDVVVAVWIGSQGKTGLTCIPDVSSIPSYNSIVN